jgi:hypothetical protein
MYTGFLYRKGKWAEIVKEPEVTLTSTVGYCQRVEGSETYMVNGEPVKISVLIDSYIDLMKINQILNK